MNLYYYRDPIGNFGDDLNPWIFGKLLPNFFDLEKINTSTDKIFVGIGTLLNKNIPKSPLKVVFGSGVGYGAAPNVHNDKYDIYCVRGPLSAAALTIPKRMAITDGALIMMNLSYPMIKQIKSKVSFMPHRRSAEAGDWKIICQLAGLNYIDPRYNVERCLNEIRSSRILITEAMHGAIVADIFRIPWIPIQSYSHILGFKWRDWCESISVPYKPFQLPSIYRAKYFHDIEKWYYGSMNSRYMKIKFKLYKIAGALYARMTFSSRQGKIVKILSKFSDRDAFLSKKSTLATKNEEISEKFNKFKKKYCRL